MTDEYSRMYPETEELTQKLRANIEKYGFNHYRNEPYLASFAFVNEENWEWLREQRARWAQPKSRKVTHLFITINPDTEKVSLTDFVAKVHKIAKFKCFSVGSQYAFEQRSAQLEDMGKGYHCHMVMEINKKPSLIRQQLLNTLKGYIGNPKHLDIQHLQRSSVKSKLKYLRGEKNTEEKLAKCQIDKRWRTAKYIAELYST